MSWQAYVDSNLVGSGKVTRAAIIGQQGGIWAKSPGYDLSTEEQHAIIAAFNNPDGVLATGVKLHGQKFFALSADPRSIYVKKAANGAVLVKTKQAVLVAEYEAPLQQQETTSVVETLADYLISVSY